MPGSLRTLEGRSNPLRSRPGVVAVVLAAIIYAILGYALSGKPPASLPPILGRLVALAPHFIAVVNASALVCLLLGWRAVRMHRIAVHRRYMIAAAALISTFLVLYVTRVALGGTKAFVGPAEIRRYLYLPMLTVHITLSVLSVPPVIYNLLIGLTYPRAAVARTRHPRVGRVAVGMWSVSLLLGLGVYLMLNVLY